MRRTIPAVMLSIALCFTILMPINPAAAAGGVPQAVLDMRPSVVRVVCFSKDGTEFYLGSGFAVGKDSVEYIVTNWHVVEENPGNVIIMRGDDRQVATSVYVQLPNKDLCVLRLNVPQYDMQPMTLCDGAPAQVGEAVYTLGFPAAADVLSGMYTGDPGNVTITGGIVSALKSWKITESGTPVDMVQMDAAISPGNSGGPLVNESGQVLGVNTLMMLLESQNINGAVSILELIDALDNNGVPYISASASQAGDASFPVYLAAGICLFAVAAAAAILFVALPRRRRKPGKKGKSISLAEYLRQWGGRLPFDTAAQVLGDALRELAAMHAQGRTHGDVCPENIRVRGNGALLGPSTGAGGKIVLRPGFSAPEQFRADGRIGPWSDVYAACAVLYRMVTGANPPELAERQAAGGGGDFGFGGASIGEAQAAVLAGLSLDAAKRPQSGAELLRALGLPLYAAPAGEAAVAALTVPQAAARVKKRGTAGRIVAAAVLVALAGGAAWLYFYEDAYYGDAAARIRAQDYEGAIEKLTHVFSVFKDAGEWMAYADAGRDMQNHSYDEARAGFRALGDFGDAKTMIREAGYQEALYQMAQGDFNRSEELFISLGDYKDSPQKVADMDYQRAMYVLEQGDYETALSYFNVLARFKYRDSAQMVLETQYRQAADQLANKDFNKALAGFTRLAKSDYRDAATMVLETGYQTALDYLAKGSLDKAYLQFKALEAYKDSQDRLPGLLAKLYAASIDAYRTDCAADTYFYMIQPYERSGDYIALINAHKMLSYPIGLSKSTAQTLYDKVSALGNFEDAVAVGHALKNLLPKLK